MTDPTIGCYLICRNNEDSLPKLLDNLKYFADKVVVVDTGSTDDTPVIAEEHGAIVFEYQYRKGWEHPFLDDFSKARNKAMNHLSTDFVCWFDTDDHPELGTLLELRKQIFACPKQYDAIATHYVVKRNKEDKSFYVSFPKTRAWRRESDYHWDGRVHEEIIGDMDKVILISLKIPTSRVNDKSRGKRNLIIFEDMISKKEPLRPHDNFYIAREYKNHGQWDQASVYVSRYIRSMQNDAVNYNARNMCNAHIFKGDIFRSKGDNDYARIAYFKAINTEDRIPMPYLRLCEMYIKEKNYNQAIPWALHAYNLPPIDPRFIDYHAEKTYIPLGFLMISYLLMGQKANAHEFYKEALKHEPADEWLVRHRRLFEASEREDELIGEIEKND